MANEPTVEEQAATMKQGREEAAALGGSPKPVVDEAERMRRMIQLGRDLEKFNRLQERAIRLGERIQASLEQLLG